MFESKEIGKYFKERKRVAAKQIHGTIDKNKWNVIREYAMFRGCPASSVEDALICFAADAAFAEATRHKNDPKFLDWQYRRTGYPPVVEETEKNG